MGWQAGLTGRYQMAHKICFQCFKRKDGQEVCPHCGYAEHDGVRQAYQLVPGTVLRKRYVIGVSIGIGGFGITYKAFDVTLGMIVAVKEFYPAGLVNRGGGERKVGIFSGEKELEFQKQLERFLQEARNMALFSKERDIVNVFDYFEDNQTAYIIMEYVEAPLLKDMLKKRRFSVEEASGYMFALLDALEKVHRHSIIHKDISPDNIFLTGEDTIKLFDFGAARLQGTERTEAVVVKAGYTPPEQYTSEDVQDFTTDIYAAGAVFYEMVTGEKPMDSRDRVMRDEIKRLEECGVQADEYLERIIFKAMALEPGLRFQNTRQFKSALASRKKVRIPQEEIIRNRRIRRVLTAGLLVVILVTGTIVGLNLTVFSGRGRIDVRQVKETDLSVWLSVKDASASDSLKNVYYAGAKEQWDNITIHNEEGGNAPLVSAAIHYTDDDFRYTVSADGTATITGYTGKDTQVILPDRIGDTPVTSVGAGAFAGCTFLTDITVPEGITSIGAEAMKDCGGLTKVTLPAGLEEIAQDAFAGTENLKDVWYGGTKDQWQQIRIEHTGGGNQTLTGAVIHLKDGTTINGPQTEEKLNSAREELAALKPGDPLSLNADLLHYLTPDQTDIVESYLFTWMAEMNFAYRYQGSSEVKRLLMARAGLDPDEDYTKGGGRAVTHITVDTKYGPKSMEVTLETGAPDSGGSLYQNFGKMQYEILEQADLPQSVPKKGWIGRTDYTDMARFIAAVELADLEMLHNTYQWQSLTSELTAGILMDQTVIGIIGAENGSFADGVYTIYKLAVLRYSKKVTIACPVDVRVCDMSGNECGSIINDRVNVSSEHVRMEVQGSTKTVYLTKDDYYINLEGTGSGTMNYTVEEIANDETKRTVQFLQMQLQKDLQYEGYVFEPLGIDSNLYALKALDGSLRVIKPDSDDFQHVFKKIKGLTLNQSGTTLGASKTIRLSAGIYPSDASNQNLKWTVDNGSVASVGSDGLVTALGAGRATITVSTLDGSNLKASCIVVVADDTGGQVNPTSPTGATSPEWKPPGQTGPGKPVTPSGPTMPSGMKPTGPDVTQPTVPVEKPPVGPVVTELYYIVRFDANGGKNLSRKTMTLLKNDSPGILPKVQRSGYYFTGWYTRQDGGSKITGDTVMEGATTLYAGWARVEKPEKVKKLKVKAGKKRIKIRFQKVSGADGYQIVYSGGRKSPAAKAKKTLVRSGSATLKKLKKGTRYAVKVRAYKTDSAKNAVYGPYSKAKHVKVK